MNYFNTQIALERKGWMLKNFKQNVMLFGAEFIKRNK